MSDQPTTTNSADATEQAGDHRVPDEVYKSYLDQRQSLSAAELDLGKSFDKWILTLAGGGLGLSITFAKQFSVGLPGAEATVLAPTWAFFAAAIVLALLSVYQSPKAHADFRDIMDQEMQAERSGPKQAQDYWARVRARQVRCWRFRLLPYVNLASVLAFLVGVVCFCRLVFCWPT